MEGWADRHLLQIAISALTLAAVCSSSTSMTEKSSESMEQLSDISEFNYTTDGSTQVPLTLELLSPCAGDDQSFCMNGLCSYHKDLNKPTCRCYKNYTGERCQHLVLDSHGEESPEKLIALGVGVFLLFCAILILFCCCLKKRCVKQKSTYKICPPENTV
ncbi:epigen [Lepisosteus oculatus]|uniref:Epithelial mitogen n=1 Tax=Lepisosteus oculatus TaxID=7918 RepID=W5N2G6_LEPOC|nr:PREDICTED: epigen [Lepisosteus oculatus]